MGSFDRLRTFIWNTRKSIWDETPPKIIKNFYTVTALAWKRDGSKVTCGGFCGAVMMFESGNKIYLIFIFSFNCFIGKSFVKITIQFILNLHLFEYFESFYITMKLYSLFQ